MSALDVEGVHTLTVRTHDGLRVQLHGVEAYDAAALLRGRFPATSLAGTALQRGRPGDLVGTFFANLFLMSPRFRSLLHEHGVLGWGHVPITVSGVALLDFGLLTVHGRCGPIRRLGPIPSDPRGLGHYIDPLSWDGSGLFVADGDRAVLVSRDTADLIRRSRLRNVDVVPAGLETLPLEPR